uniref:Zinc finger protein 346 n=1 Tax=Hippocampus comes TaxID=109280 RepID=A0A3Q2XVU9_HIPCM
MAPKSPQNKTNKKSQAPAKFRSSSSFPLRCQASFCARALARTGVKVLLEPRAQVMMAVAMDTDQFPYLPSGPDQVNQMIKEHGNLFTDSLCSVCNAVLISESQKLAHYQSKKHGNKVRRYLSIQSENEPETKKFKSLSSHDTNNGESDPMKACKMCKMTFTSPVMAQSHYQGKIHAKNLKLKSVDPHTSAAAVVEVAAAATGNGGHGGDKDPDRFCSICQASFNNAQMAQQHYSGKKHKKHLAKQDLMKLYGKPATPASTAKGLPCTLCNIELNSVDQYQSHISGAKHKNQYVHPPIQSGPSVALSGAGGGGGGGMTKPSAGGIVDVAQWNAFQIAMSFWVCVPQAPSKEVGSGRWGPAV